MSFDKVKAMRNAERFLAQGKIRAAISEYTRVVEFDKTDFSTLNMLGDLHAKASEIDEAVNCFMQVAEHYRKQDFAQKAIAIYNKISRLKPDSLEVSAKLAQLYQMKGSFAEARTHYTTLAEQYNRTGKKAEALSVWKQIASLDTKDADIYLKIADACWQDQQKEEAASAYIEAGTRLNAKKQFESAVTAFSRALEITPDDVKALKGFVETQMNLGYPDEAAKSLESSLARQPHNREINYLLIDCYLKVGDLLAAENEVVKLVENEPSNYPKLLDVVQGYLNVKNAASATRILSMASEHMLVGGQAVALGKFIEEILSIDSEFVDAIRLSVRCHTWQRDEANIRLSLERLAEAAKINNRPDDEVYALTQLVMIVPQNAYFPQRLHELSVNGRFEEDYYLDKKESSSSEVPTFESYAGLVDEDSNQIPADATFGEYNHDLNSTNGDAYFESDRQINQGNEFDHSYNNLTDSNEVNENYQIEDANRIGDEENSQLNNEESIPTSYRELSAYERHTLVTDLEGVTFYIEQGFFDLAEKTIIELEKNFGNQAEIEEVKAKLNNQISVSGNEDSNGDESEQAEESSSKLIETEQNFEQSQNDFGEYQSEENSFAREDQDSLDSAAESYSEGTTPQTFSEDLVENQTEVGTETTDSSIQNDFSPKSEQTEEFEKEEIITKESLVDESIENSLQNEVSENLETETIEGKTETETEQTETTNLSDTEEPQNVAEKPIVEERKTSDDEFELHYQTGIAYKEMGLIENSIREFQDAIKQVSLNDGTKRYFWCCNLLAHTFMEKGMPSIAVMWYKRCLGAENLNEEELNGLHYELGNAYEKSGDKQNAIKHFEEIYGIDVDFRDVGERLQNLMMS